MISKSTYCFTWLYLWVDGRIERRQFMAIGTPAGHINCFLVDSLAIGLAIGIGIGSIFTFAIRAKLAAAIDSWVAAESVVLIFDSG